MQNIAIQITQTGSCDRLEIAFHDLYSRPEK